MGKFGLIASSNPILFGALRMGILFLCLVPFCNLKIPPKKYFVPLFGFSICMGAGVNMFLYLSIDAASILAPITIGAQLAIPFAINLRSLFLKETISIKKWILISWIFLKRFFSPIFFRIEYFSCLASCSISPMFAPFDVDVVLSVPFLIIDDDSPPPNIFSHSWCLA